MLCFFLACYYLRNSVELIHFISKKNTILNEIERKPSISILNLNFIAFDLTKPIWDLLNSEPFFCVNAWIRFGAHLHILGDELWVHSFYLLLIVFLLLLLNKTH